MHAHKIQSLYRKCFIFSYVFKQFLARSEFNVCIITITFVFFDFQWAFNFFLLIELYTSLRPVSLK